MKRSISGCIMILCMVLTAACAPIGHDVITPADASFDLDTDGLVQVHTVDESDKTVKNYALASGDRIMETDAFTPDSMQVYTVDSFSLWEDNMVEGPLRAYDKPGREVPVTREIDTICHAMRDVGHHVMKCSILRVGDEWFVSAELNVNLWAPYQFYYFNRESGRLMLLYVFNGRDITSLRILSAEKLHALDQSSIGGWYDPFTPYRLMEEQPDVLENAAQMFLRRDDLFDEAYTRSGSRVRRIAVGNPFTHLTYKHLLHGQESVDYLNDDEKAVFQALLDLCMPYMIEQIPGSAETCTVLIFYFYAFDQETNSQEKYTLFRLDDTPESSLFVPTVTQLEERYGELTPFKIPGWMIASPAKQ